MDMILDIYLNGIGNVVFDFVNRRKVFEVFYCCLFLIFSCLKGKLLYVNEREC